MSSDGAAAQGSGRLLAYWQKRVGAYLRQCRINSKLGQKSVPGLSRATVSLMEKGEINFSIKTLIDFLEATGGDISEAFKSSVPKKFHGPNRDWHEMLQEILESGDPTEIHLVQRMLSRDGPNQDWHEMLQEILESGNSTEIDFVQRLLTRSSDSLRRGNDNGPAPS
jgi:hypothetical protein